MAAARMPGPTPPTPRLKNSYDGTSNLSAMPAPGPIRVSSAAAAAPEAAGLGGSTSPAGTPASLERAAGIVLPKHDGQVNAYNAVEPANNSPRIYYVNGIQTDARTHAMTATSLSLLTEHVVLGIYNASAGAGAGMVLDLLQCGDDWIDGFLAKVAEIGAGGANAAITTVMNFVRSKLGKPSADPVNVAESIRKRIPEAVRLAFLERYLASNKATASLFGQLRQHLSQKQIIIAHSQGNLITANALWAVAIALGDQALANMQMYSLASPAPAWPLGIRGRRKVYGHTNDLVTLCDPHNWTFITSRLANGRFGRTAGDWRRFGKNWAPGLDGHDLGRNVALNFATTIRKDLKLPALEGALPTF